MSDLSNTQFFQVEPGPQISAKDILEIVFKDTVLSSRTRTADFGKRYFGNRV